MSFLKNLETKSSTTKANYAFAFASVITGLIVIIWMSTISARFSDMKGSKQAEKKDGQAEANAKFLDTAKSQLGNLVNWDKAKTTPTTEEVPVDYSTNMENLDVQAGDTVYAGDSADTVPIVHKEVTPQPEPNLEKTPGIKMPTNITPQTVPEKMPEPTSHAPVPESGAKKVLIEITNVPRKPILIETRSDPQKVLQN